MILFGIEVIEFLWILAIATVFVFAWGIVLFEKLFRRS